LAQLQTKRYSASTPQLFFSAAFIHCSAVDSGNKKHAQQTPAAWCNFLHFWPK